ncbi:asparagine synthase (glutamine-hydrolyzing) [Candidatus Uhrbacteria bacterium RIFCSPLOWO2_12_FULL_46_10]|uniref:asparagine synthase (glutamine-hydrolyzing) n=1 Tax=Candidatus Uhrbacteria bacterium RIFCSPLOWO2_01_FULL_47_25 TaxID=1802402 RepID=A0A1F7UPP8_9BACT|nr:MAG: Asparagine synthetase [Parcubacteria group bacterium GW2011_GWA2_46_9]OGL61008.1 MAG: asparagine synthase (glutamine-hydrolyzing) [Candidatus Uhrbacteria bacterium RIFCSPHIGHO2_01_FULL_46_23]OGL69220.1 MAG: asparagine synthase (glutamine-hydrolyzing) [Candidatus Uhrbacteria bacterium RIFCSPHIGHO2_02_FULL_47_29]OGL80283.1 MAG: asparagine synthase (glutamine-hydrolyzing) [Candidatus Uhrbacteria bacterium RIFCSPLOWO2_01_FULL_47_25]OGL85358.1 MAG: asparagine synthase (glutamine-hydrolyzing)
MCGITGKIYFHNGGRVSEKEIHRMNEKIKHRGPDGEGIYINQRGNVGLGHRRLAIIDLSPAGHQPMSNEDGTVWIVFNGEIYNFQSLRHDLEKQGHKFKSHTDTEIIIHLWEEHGENCLKYLRGMFAFAIWDERKQKLFLARDRVGKKPLKYYIGKDFIVFASELKAFLGEPDVPREMDFEAIHHYLTFQYVPHPMTGFKNVKKLPAAHYLTINLFGTTPKISEPTRYWNLDYSKKLNLSEEEWCERILAKLNECVKIRMIADVPLGAFLSGGVDSSAIVALMAKNSPQPVKTFSIGFSEKAFSELPYARMVAERYGTNHQEFIVEPNAIEVLPKLVYHYEEPYADSSALPTFYLSQMTRQYVTVALNGDGGDENFAGYPWYHVMHIAARYNKLPYLIKKTNHLIVDTIARFMHQSAFLRYGMIYTKGSLSSPAYMHTELLAYLNEQEKETMYNNEYLSLLESHPTWKFLEQYYMQARRYDPIDAALFTDINTYLANDLLPKVDVASMSVSLEARSPLLDHEFMELVAQIPSSLKIRHGEKKYIFKKLLEPLVPREVMYRKKRGFNIPINLWFHTSLYEYAKEILLNNNALNQLILKENAVESLLSRHHQVAKEGRRIWLLLTLELWFQNFLKYKA